MLAGTLGLAGCQGVGMAMLHGANVLARAGAYELQDDVSYGPDERHRLDVYTPTRGEPPHPVVVFFHGGDWSEDYPDKDNYRFLGDALTSRGFVAVVANYRRYPQVRHPTFVEDAARAVVWTREHIAEHAGDRDAIFLMGHSAGAHLASLLALDEQYMRGAGGDPAWIAGVVGLAGPYDFPPAEDVPDLAAIFGLGQRYERAQPINLVSGAAPPMLLVGGLRDERVPVVVNERMARELTAAGGEVEQLTYDALGHVMLVGSLAAPVRWSQPVVDDVAAWIERRSAEGRARAQAQGLDREAERAADRRRANTHAP